MCEATPLLRSGAISDLKEMERTTAAISALQTGRVLMTGRWCDRDLVQF